MATATAPYSVPRLGTDMGSWPPPDLGGNPVPESWTRVSDYDQRAAYVALEAMIRVGMQVDRPTPSPAPWRTIPAPAPRSYGATSLGRRDVVAAATAPRPGIITKADLVAGANRDADYLLLAWNGAGELSRGLLVGALMELEVDHGVTVKAPDPKSAHAHLGRAVDLLRYRGFKISAERGRKRRDNKIKAAWIVGEGNTRGDIGDNFGRIVMRVMLESDGTPRFAYEDGYSGLADEVSTEYRRTANAEAYPPGDITQWANMVLLRQFRAVRMGQVWVVPSEHARAAEQFCSALADRCSWGRDWMLPGIPVATTTALMGGMARGLREEVALILKDLEYQRTQAKAASDGKRSEIGPAAATTLLARLTTVQERVTSYAVALGADLVAGVHKAVADAIATVQPLTDDSSQRAAMLELD